LALSQTFEISKLGGETGLYKWKPVERIKIHSLQSYINNTAFCEFLLFHAPAAVEEVNNKGCANT
jgi:hypothetical protein